jgi:hypothetical protein
MPIPVLLAPLLQMKVWCASLFIGGKQLGEDPKAPKFISNGGPRLQAGFRLELPDPFSSYLLVHPLTTNESSIFIE